MANKYVWKTDVRGRIFVNDRVGQESYLPTLVSPKSEHMDTHVLPMWKKLCTKASKDTNVPASWLLGVIYKENIGYANIANTDLGLSGVRSPVFRKSAEIENPEKAVYNMATLMAQLIDIVGLDLPAVASSYVAGLNRNKPWLEERSPWGLREPAGYILEVVAANNYGVTKGVKLPVSLMPEPKDLAN